MYIIFFISLLGIILVLAPYFFSVEHIKLQEKYGGERGIKIAKALGLISGWGFFLFLFGIWISPQPKFKIPILKIDLEILPMFNFSIILFHLIISIPIILVGAWFGLVGVKEITLKVAETHLPEKVISTGIYSRIRHPQYFGAILSHIGISILFSSLYSILSTPLIVFLIYLISWKEEKELLREFGKDYENYKKIVPMLFPRIKSRNKN